MIEPYTGEFLVSPIPTELSGNACSFACPYCFANLNKRERVAAIDSIFNLLRDFPKRQTLVAKWLQQGAGICFSNKVDPFAPSNLRQSLEIMERCNLAGVQLQIQSRGPQHLKRDLPTIMGLLPTPIVWYVTIEIWDRTIWQRVSPATPSIAKRLALIEALRKQGHTVVVGINPAVPEWLPYSDAEQLIACLAELGVHGVWIERLHFSPPQFTAMTSNERSQIGELVLSQSRKRYMPDAVRSYLDWLRQCAQQHGLEIYSVGQANSSLFFEPYHRLYRTTLPTMQDFINHCHNTMKPFGFITFAQFRDFFQQSLPSGVWPIDAYVSSARSLWSKRDIPAQMSFAELLRIIYHEPGYKLNPARLASFAYAGEHTEKGWIQLTDKKGDPYLVWSPTGHTDMYIDYQSVTW